MSFVSRSYSPARSLAVCALAFCVAIFGFPAAAQDEVEGVFGGFGNARSLDDAAPTNAAAEGNISGQIFDGSSGTPLAGVTVILLPPADREGSKQEVQLTDGGGDFDFRSVAPGLYELTFIKSGYQTSKLTALKVIEGEEARADFPLPAIVSESGGEVLQLDAFVVEASTANDMMLALDLRLESDELTNVMSSDDLSKYAAGDVADALKRVAGVNVVEGQFAIIRGLEDRYSSTMYNGAPVPSPDPDKQSVQLDLFPSDVVSSLVVSKTFGTDLPGNSAGGSINILTHDYPEEWQAKISLGTGFSDNAGRRFLKFADSSGTGLDRSGYRQALERDTGASFGGRKTWANREVRIKAVANWEVDYQTKVGTQEKREPDRAVLPGKPRPRLARAGFRSGDLSLGELNLSGGRFDETSSERSEQQTAYFGFGFDVDEAGDHKIDSSVLWTRKLEEAVQLRENGFLPSRTSGFATPLDYTLLLSNSDAGDITASNAFLGWSTLGAALGRGGVRDNDEDAPSRGALWFTNFSDSKTFERERELLVYQTNGDHVFTSLDDFHVSWSLNQASTKQEATSRGTAYFFEPDDFFQAPPTRFPSRVSALGSGRYVADKGDILFSQTSIEENQDFLRVDGDYEFEPLAHVVMQLSSGAWYERARRGVDSEYLQTASPRDCTGSNRDCQGIASQFVLLGDTPSELGRNLYQNLATKPNGAFAGGRETTNDSDREIWAWHTNLKTTLWNDFDLFGGVRLENVSIQSVNDAFIGENDPEGVPKIFPSAYLLFDRFDNPLRAIEQLLAPAGTVFNDEILGIRVPIVNGKVDLLDRKQISASVNSDINERFYLPSAGFSYRALEGLVLRGAYSQTVVRPSFRELGYYVTVAAGSDDQVVGNPQLVLSEVESLDGRLEHSWGDLGDLVAFSAFYKTIENPIESIIIRDPTNADFGSSSLFRTFFNNRNGAKLWGIEVEGHKAIDFLGVDALEYLSLGANFTYIQAEVERSSAEIRRSVSFFGLNGTDRARFNRLSPTRRLFGQPEWIANVDISFDHPEWGTKMTLAAFAISDVLDAAGSANLDAGGNVVSASLDRYIDSFYQLDLVLSQRIFEGLTLKVSVKNLTDSTRRLVYDRDQTVSRIAEREYRIGRDYSFSLQYQF